MVMDGSMETIRLFIYGVGDGCWNRTKAACVSTRPNEGERKKEYRYGVWYLLPGTEEKQNKMTVIR